MFFLKHATESSFLILIGVLFHSLVAETAKERLPSDSLLHLGQTALMLEYLVLRECRLLGGGGGGGGGGKTIESRRRRRENNRIEEEEEEEEKQ